MGRTTPELLGTCDIRELISILRECAVKEGEENPPNMLKVLVFGALASRVEQEADRVDKAKEILLGYRTFGVIDDTELNDFLEGSSGKT